MIIKNSINFYKKIILEYKVFKVKLAIKKELSN